MNALPKLFYLSELPGSASDLAGHAASAGQNAKKIDGSAMIAGWSTNGDHAASFCPMGAAGAPNGKTTSCAVIMWPALRTFSITIGCLVDGIRRAVFQLWTVDGGSPIMSATARVPPSRAKRSVSLVIGA